MVTRWGTSQGSVEVLFAITAKMCVDHEIQYVGKGASRISKYVCHMFSNTKFNLYQQSKLHHRANKVGKMTRRLSLSHSSKLHTVLLTTNTFILYDPFLVRQIGDSLNSRSLI